MGHYTSKFHGWGETKYEAFNALLTYMKYYGCTDIYPDFFTDEDARITFKYKNYNYDTIVVYKENRGFYHAYIF